MNNKTVELLKKRNLEGSYLVLYCIKVEIYVEEGQDYVNQKPLYIFMGCTLSGKRMYIGAVLKRKEMKISDWYDYFESLKSRKLEHIIFGLIPNEKEIKEAIKLSFPEVEVFNSCDYIIKKLKKYNSFKFKEEIFREVKRLYLSRDKKEYKINYEVFKEKYQKYSFIMEMLEEEIQSIEKNYKYSQSIRRIIYSFNYIIEFEKRLSVISNGKNYKTAEDFVKELVWYINRTESTVHFIKSEWINIINEIYEEKKELIKPYL